MKKRRMKKRTMLKIYSGWYAVGPVQDARCIVVQPTLCVFMYTDLYVFNCKH